MINKRAKALFIKHNPYPGDGLLHHNFRIAEFSLMLAQKERCPVDEDLLRAACHLHDLGLLVRVPGEPSYLRRSWLFVEPLAIQWSLTEGALDLLRQILLFNHALRPVPQLHPVADLVRRAVQIEHSRGWIRHGLAAASIRKRFVQWPRLNLTRVLLDFARITLLEDGPRQLRPIFFPRL